MISSHLDIFLLTIITLALVPGPDMIFILGQTLTNGLKTGLTATLGIASGLFVHILLVTLGISTWLFRFPIIFHCVKILGAGYLIYVGMQLFKRAHGLVMPQSFSVDTRHTIFWQGFWTNVLNPKVALFFIAFLPQFTSPKSAWPVTGQIFFLGVLFNVVGSSINAMVAVFSGIMKHWLATKPRWLILQLQLSGIILVVVALGILYSELRALI